ncbi:MAG: SAM-dependent methyltransferase [Verrucomicrobiales bacterium]
MRTPADDWLPWLVRVPEVFSTEGAGLVRLWSPGGATRLGTEFHLLKRCSPESMIGPEASLFVLWRLPVHHSWPCRPRTMPGFVEKAAQALARRFGPHHPQTVLVGLLQTGTPNTYYKKLASNVRGRALQVFAMPQAAANQSLDPDRPVVFCLLGPEGLYAGLSTPRQAGGFRPGGQRSMARSGPDSISRAGAKIEEALEFSRVLRAPLPPGAHWLELGASPGGMTAALLAHGYRVTAVDRAPLNRRLAEARGVTFVQVDAPDFRAPSDLLFDGLLCDLNGEPSAAMNAVCTQRPSLRSGSPVVFTLKLAGVESVAGAVALRDKVVVQARKARFALVAQTHLPSNRREFTLFFETTGGPAGR